MYKQLSEVPRSNIMTLARQHLINLFGPQTEELTDLRDEAASPRVNVTLRTSGLVRGSMSGSGSSLGEQICDAVRRASLDDRFSGAIVQSDLDDVRIEVWIQYDSCEIDVSSASDLSDLLLGIYGVDVEQGMAFAYYKPSVSLTSSFSTADDLLGTLCRKAGLSREAWKEESCTVRRTLWLHYAESSSVASTRLVGLRKPMEDQRLSKAFVSRWLDESAHYLTHSQDSQGSVCYKYDPLTGSSPKEATNPVRASGCAYALSAAASYLTKEHDAPWIRDSTRRAINAIVKREATSVSGQVFINDSFGKSAAGGKLGSTALLTLAMLGTPFAKDYEYYISRFLVGIKEQQRSNGSLATTYGSLVESSSQVNFFPGQALLACVVRAISGDPSFSDVYRASFDFYQRHFRTSPSSAFVGWHVDVWTRAALNDQNDRYANFVFEQTDWLLKIQNLDTSRREYGAFMSATKPAGYSSLVYVEAVARAAALAFTIGDRARYEWYRQAVHAGLRFCSLLRVTPDQAMFCQMPQRACGGVTTSLTSFLIRSDFVQHAVTMNIALLENQHLLD